MARWARSIAKEYGGRTRARTWDPLIKSQLLYQLSYASVPCGKAGDLEADGGECNAAAA